MVDFNKLLQQTRAAQPTTAQPTAAVEPAQQAPTPTAKTATVAPAVAPAAATTSEPELDLGDLGMEPELAAKKSVEPAGTVVEYPGLVDLSQRIYSLEESLKTSHPMMESLLQQIHRNLQKDPELLHLLKPEQTAIIFAGLQKKTQTKIVEESVKSASSGGGKKKLSKITLDEL